MHLIGQTRLFSAFLLILLLLTACAPATPVMPSQLLPTRTPDRTSIVIEYHTPQPSPTQPLPTPAPSLTPNNDPDYFYGSLTITLDYAGQTVPLKKGENFLLSLGDNYIWNIVMAPSSILTRNMKITPEAGEQGVYVARDRGKVLFTAIGEPVCRKSNPPCGRPSILFEMTVFVE